MDLLKCIAELNDDVLFGEVWNRESKLSLRDRSMITIASLMSQGLFPQLKSHFILGKEHGITQEEAVEIVTQLAFYAGWPKAWSAFPIISEVYGNEESKTTQGGGFGMGEPNVNFAKYFTGNSYLKPLTDPNKTSIFLANVTFEPGCRNNWHIHTSVSGGGQILICVEGEGWYQEEGKEAISLKPGMVITIPANVKHWHGAKKDSWFSHIAVEVPGENTSNEWCEPVTDEEYDSKYDEEIKNLLVELQEHIVQIDKEHYNIVGSNYRNEYFNKTIDEIKKYNGKMYLYKENEKICGLIVGLINNDEIDTYDFKAPKRGRISELVVSNKCREKGYGKILLNSMENYLKSVGCKDILIGVFAYNEGAINFYEKNGYHIRMTEMIKKETK